jgi:hypothetical protein
MRKGLEGSPLSRPIDLSPCWRWVVSHPAGVLLGLGVTLRIWVYLGNRSYWMDESSLLGNLHPERILDFSRPLFGDQLAPLGFLIVERIMVRLFGASTYATRFVPLLAGIASLFAFNHVARRLLSPRAALWALALFSFSDDLIYYSTELKPYSIDLAMALILTWLTLASIGKSLPTRLVLRWLALIAIAPWISFPSAFLVAGCGLALLVDAARGNSRRDAGMLLAIGLLWVVNSLAAYRASQALLSPYTSMYIFWDFAFLPVPRTAVDASKAAGILLETLVNPLNLVAPFGPLAGWTVLWLGLGVVGCMAWLRSESRSWIAVSAPIALAMLASGLHRFPFHGRLILELVPAFFLFLAKGVDRVARWIEGPCPGFRRARLATLVMLLLLSVPCARGIANAIQGHTRDFNSHGDLHSNRFIR